MSDKEYEDAINDKTPSEMDKKLAAVHEKLARAEKERSQILLWCAVGVSILALIAWLLWQLLKTRLEPVHVVVQQEKPILVAAQVQSAPSHVMVHTPKPEPPPPVPAKVLTGFATPTPDADAPKE